MESPPTITATTRPPIDTTTDTQLASSMRTPSPQNISQTHDTTSARSRVRGHLEPLVHTTQISTTRSLSFMSTTTYRRLYRALPILCYHQTTRKHTSAPQRHDTSEFTHIHAHQSTTAHTRRVDTIRTTHLRNLPCAQPSTPLRYTTQFRRTPQRNVPMDSGGGTRTSTYVPSTRSRMDDTTEQPTATHPIRLQHFSSRRCTTTTQPHAHSPDHSPTSYEQMGKSHKLLIRSTTFQSALYHDHDHGHVHHHPQRKSAYQRQVHKTTSKPYEVDP